MSLPPQVVVSGAFDELSPRHVRFLEEASRLGPVTVLLWSDERQTQLGGRPPRFPLAERRYFLEAVRYVTRVVPLSETGNPDELPAGEVSPRSIWVDDELHATPGRQAFCRRLGIEYRALPGSQMTGFPPPVPMPTRAGQKKVLVTGCYDWFHTGHIRFFEEVSHFGDLYVVVGHDANIRLLKGQGHPLFPEAERRYMVGSIKYVKEALISSGDGWLDAEPEIKRLKPDIYVVNEDGDKGGKRDYCAALGIEYRVLKRTPAPGLARRSSTDLRGF